MAKWKNDFGEQFEDRDEAFENIVENITKDDYIDGLVSKVSVHEIIEWAWNRAGFLEEFENELYEVEEEYFDTYYHEIEEEEKEDE